MQRAAAQVTLVTCRQLEGKPQTELAGPLGAIYPGNGSKVGVADIR